MTKDELIAWLQQIPGNPDVYVWDSLDAVEMPLLRIDSDEFRLVFCPEEEEEDEA